MRFYKDRLFYLFLAVGPLFWLVYGVFFTDVSLLKLDSSDAVWVFLQVCLLYPAMEEVVFRGGLQGVILQPRLGRSFHGVSLANLVTSLVFAGFHLFNHEPLWAALIFFPSLVFGYVFERNKSLSAPIILHAVYNTGFYVLFST